MQIHPTAIIEDGAIIGSNVHVGPYSIIGKDVTIGDDVKIDSHVVIAGNTSVGARTHIFPFASIGHVPQDLKFKGEKTFLEIGEDNMIREYVTIHLGTEQGGGITKVGNHCLFMTACHIAHDCTIGDHVVLAANLIVGGHGTVGDYAILGGMSAVHQFCQIGTHAFLGSASMLVGDLIPFGMALGNRAVLCGLNFVGLKRRGFEAQYIRDLKRCYKTLFEDTSNGNMSDRLSLVESEYEKNPLVEQLIDAVKSGSGRGFCLPKNK